MSSIDSDASVRSAWGVGMIQTITALILESVLYGAYIILIIFALRTLIQKRTSALRGPHIFMLGAVSTIFLMSTTLWAIDVYDILRPMYEMIVWTQGSMQSRINRYVVNMNERVFGQTVVYTFEFLLGDVVVVWRACALYNFRIKVLFAPLLMLSAATVMSFFFVGCIVHDDLKFIEGQSPVCNHAQFSTFFLSLATNALATGFIIYKAWRMRQLIKAASIRRTPSVSVMVLLMESGFIYFIIWAAKSFTYFPIVFVQGPIHFAAQILNSIGNQIVGLYPTVIIVLVHLQQSIWDADGAICTVSFREGDFSPIRADVNGVGVSVLFAEAQARGRSGSGSELELGGGLGLDKGAGTGEGNEQKV